MKDLLRGQSFLGCLLCGWLLSTAAAVAADKELFFESDVRPIFKLHCFHCHGEEEKPEAGLDLRLVRWMARGGDSGPAVAPGSLDESPIWQRIDAGEMPPKGAGLSEDEKRIVRTWIEQGSRTRRPEPESLEGVSIWTDEERNYWAFQPPVRPELPAVRHRTQVQSPIDHFLLAKLEQVELAYAEQADRATLARRLSFGLLGLPPTPEMLESF
ncbi:MAG: c-type cytochrome domain-containing protein, partial [Aureliella sp.]